jgi:hypothetical protein
MIGAAVNEGDLMLGAQRAAKPGRRDDAAAAATQDHYALSPVGRHRRVLCNRSRFFESLPRSQTQSAQIPQALRAPKLLFLFAVSSELALEPRREQKKAEQKAVGQVLYFFRQPFANGPNQ